MKITYELDLNSFEAWSGAVCTLNRVIEEGKTAELEAVLEELYPDGLDETTLNDILWFDDEWVFELCGIRSESVIREELEEAKKRDHRKIGKELELFTFSEPVGKGLPLWLPKGTALRLRLEDFLKQIQKRFARKFEQVCERTVFREGR